MYAIIVGDHGHRVPTMPGRSDTPSFRSICVCEKGGLSKIGIEEIPYLVVQKNSDKVYVWRYDLFNCKVVLWSEPLV